TVDERAEVGLLSHNVRVLGQSRTTPAPAGMGGHIMVAAEEQSFLVNPGFGRFSGIELFNMGRTVQLGRYSMHWHLLLGSGKGVYMKGSSIHSSNSRVIAVHGTDYTLFEDNVALDH